MKNIINKIASPLVIIASGLCIQFLFVAYTFPISELFTSTPLLYVDNATHWYYLKLIGNLANGKHLTGYDPYFNAGTPAGIATNVSGHAGQLLSILLSPYFTETQIWKCYIFFIAILGPVLPSLGLKLLKFPTSQIGVCLMLSFFLWWTSWFHWFHVVGMASYVFACFLSFLVICLLLNYRNSANLSSLLLTGGLGSVLIFIHPIIIIMILIFLGCFFIFNFQELKNWKTVFFVVVFIMSSFLLNGWWLETFFSPLNQTFFKPVIHQAEVIPANFFLEMIGVWSGHAHGSKVYPLLIMLSTVAIFKTSPEQKRFYVWPFLLAWFLLQLYAVGAGMSSVLARLTQPNRLAPAGYLLLIVPSVLAFQEFNYKQFASLSLKQIPRQLLYLILILLTAINWKELLREVSYGEHGHYSAPPPYVKAIGPYSNFVLNLLAKETDASARVLFETSAGRIHDGGHMAGYYAYSSDREFIGGPYTTSSFAGFRDGFIFGLPIKDIPPLKFIEYLKLYNIGWIIAHSVESKNYLKQFNSILPGASFKELQFYTVNEKYGFFLKGSGIIKQRQHNLINLSELSSGTVELKYHYFESLKSNPEVTMEPVYMMDDPIPFIRLIDPPRNITITLEP